MTNKKKHEFAVIATDIVIFTIKDEELNVLLIKMKRGIFKGLWAVPGGLVRPNESVELSAKRNLTEKTRLIAGHLEQLYTLGAVDRDPYGRVVAVIYFALIPTSSTKLKPSEDREDTDWFPIGRLAKLAYDHEEAIHLAVDRLRGKLAYTNIAYSLLPEKFTLSELQNVYEIVLCKKIDKRNFRKKITSVKMLYKTGEKTSGQAHRPADLYRFAHRSPMIIQIL